MLEYCEKIVFAWHNKPINALRVKLLSEENALLDHGEERQHEGGKLFIFLDIIILLKCSKTFHTDEEIVSDLRRDSIFKILPPTTHRERKWM